MDSNCGLVIMSILFQIGYLWSGDQKYYFRLAICGHVIKSIYSHVIKSVLFQIGYLWSCDQEYPRQDREGREARAEATEEAGVSGRETEEDCGGQDTGDTIQTQGGTQERDTEKASSQ